MISGARTCSDGGGDPQWWAFRRDERVEAADEIRADRVDILGLTGKGLSKDGSCKDLVRGARDVERNLRDCQVETVRVDDVPDVRRRRRGMRVVVRRGQMELQLSHRGDTRELGARLCEPRVRAALARHVHVDTVQAVRAVAEAILLPIHEGLRALRKV